MHRAEADVEMVGVDGFFPEWWDFHLSARWQIKDPSQTLVCEGFRELGI